MYKILIVEDDKDIQETLKFFLEDNGYDTEVADDGMEAIEKIEEKQWNLILLDILLPKIDGYAVCEFIRRKSNVPVIMITALTSEEDQIKALDLLADDYITKPFSIPVLLRKVGAVLRRSCGDDNKGIINYRNMKMDIDNYKVFMDGKEIILTKREFEILRELLVNRGRILTREILMERVWQYEYMGNVRVVDNHIKNIRKKLPEDYIITIKGVGYRID